MRCVRSAKRISLSPAGKSAARQRPALARHHVLADRGFAPKGIVFPVSAVIFDYIEKYRQTLQSVSEPIMDFIEWETDEKLNIKILNDTIVLYQFFDLTKNCEFFYDVVKTTIEKNLPEEIAFLEK